jgi:Na+-translocating ferredoxin:NAD+ oxidoreductase RnfG subunit
MPSAPVRLAFLFLSLLLVGDTSRTEAKVFHARDEALEIAFPGAERTEARDFFLTDDQKKDIERRARAPVDSDLLTVYLGYRDGQLMGYAIFDTHVVRTLPETFLVVLSPDGKVRTARVLAFYEPLEYQPSDRWLALFEGKTLSDDLHIGRGIAAITGSTLTSRAVVGGIRRALAIHEVLLDKE